MEETMERAKRHWKGRVVQAAAAGALLGIAWALAAVAAEPAPWTTPLERVDGALARKQYSAAVRAWQEAHAAALAAPGWEGLVAAGQAYRRIGEATGFRKSADAKARDLYMTALTRARREPSVPGVLRVAEAFHSLGDRDVALQCARIAERLALRDPEAQADVRAAIARLSESPLLAGEGEPGLVSR
jgi:hypothetical protein